MTFCVGRYVYTRVKCSSGSPSRGIKQTIPFSSSMPLIGNLLPTSTRPHVHIVRAVVEEVPLVWSLEARRPVPSLRLTLRRIPLLRFAHLFLPTKGLSTASAC